MATVEIVRRAKKGFTDVFHYAGRAVDESTSIFTSGKPEYVVTIGMLVQVRAVAVDGVDQTLVRGAWPSPTLSSSRTKRKSKDGESTKRLMSGSFRQGALPDACWSVDGR